MSEATSFAGGLPAGPPGGALAHTWAWIRRPTEMMLEAKATYGRRFTVRFLGDRQFVFLHHPDDVKATFAASPDVLQSGHANAAFVPFFGRFSLMTLDGDTHRRHRKLMMPPFRGETLAAYMPLIERITREEVATWPLGEDFSLHDRMRTLTFTIITKAIFGVHEAPRVEAIRGYVHRMMNGIGPRLIFIKSLQRDFGPLSPWGRFLRLRASLFAELQREIDALRDAGSVRDDVLARLIAESRARNEPLSDEELHHELLALLIAGHETSSTALAWVFQYLMHDADAFARARGEARGDSGELHPDRLPFLSAVVSETVRLMPPIPIVVRYVAKSVDIAGWDPPLGTYLAPCAYLAHRDPEVFPDAETFRPARFLQARLPPWVYFPYGGGPRLCIGANFAHYEVVNILATILRTVDLAPAGPAVVRPERVSITIGPSGGTPARVEARH